ncbi:glycosyltransferase family 2 protein [Microbacterium sp. Marseille-Q6965]|uniref:glycosyltransferase family 2 protein n=1 Tax=Microbacterium sp. Marseille-Q6965 TaxID=2965072 RepID=UPI0021B71DBE|nr:glycosyltransferase family 2 protein [Microbacterium sp. Marseille-Q6965]
MTASDRLALEYVLPLRRNDDSGEEELVRYLRALSSWVDVTVVDGSDDPLFRRLDAALAGTTVRHAAPFVDGTNGKARGAVSGLLRARHDRVVIADDDVRYTRADLEAVHDRLRRADVVRVQNAYRPLPWHARWDTGRILLNRALGGDYGGTLGVRAPLLGRRGGYRTDVLFENLELERTIRAEGGSVDVPLGLLVRRLPPTVPHFLGQRVRQAYDGFAQPVRLLAELSVLPLVVVLMAAGRAKTLAGAIAGVVCVAEFGRRRGGAARAFPPTSALWAPLWLAERAVTAWLAVAARARGGVRYGPSRLRTAASPLRRLRAAAAHENRDRGDAHAA